MTETRAPLTVAEFGSRRPTISDIARLANVSKKTVSRVLNRSPHVREETRLKISAIIDELGFAPDPQARGLALRRGLPEIPTTARPSFREIFAASPVCAVVTLLDATLAAPVAEALAKGGIKTLEITLRTPAGLPAIRKIAREVPEILVGAGSVLKTDDLYGAIDAGARFAISPGATPSLLAVGQTAGIPYLPGVATASELMAAIDHGYDRFKIFPIMPMGGVQFARILGGPFPHAKFCANGGVALDSSALLLQEPNIVGVGVVWLTPPDALNARDFARIEALARTAVDKLRKTSG